MSSKGGRFPFAVLEAKGLRCKVYAQSQRLCNWSSQAEQGFLPLGVTKLVVDVDRELHGPSADNLIV